MYGLKNEITMHAVLCRTFHRGIACRSKFPLRQKWRCTRCSSSKIYDLKNEKRYKTDKNSSILFVSPVWPERKSSAAGVRTESLIFQQFKKCDVDKITYVSLSAPSEYSKMLNDQGIETFTCHANKEADFVEALDHAKPTTIIFDRYYIEEMFSFHCQKHCPQAMRVLDMQDVHALRTYRQKMVVERRMEDLNDVAALYPDSSYEPLLRELAAVLRSDLTLVCSPIELDLLEKVYGIPKRLLCEAGFFQPKSPFKDSSPGFDARRHAMMIGNFKHPPNLDSVQWACKTLWPKIRLEMQKSTGISSHMLPELHIFGAYSTEAQKSLNDEANGIYLKGFAPSLDIMLDYRILFAPLRFGAGLKGKIVEAWWHGMPVLTTRIGAEGMQSKGMQFEECSTEQQWGGSFRSFNTESLVLETCELYYNKEMWERSRLQGFYLLETLYDEERNLSCIQDAIDETWSKLEVIRRDNYLMNILWSQQYRSTEFFSRWIELKEQKNALPLHGSDNSHNSH
eukprot:jgi/Picsp_1/2096/NSC_05561-R1_glycosyltransferase family 4 protein